MYNIGMTKFFDKYEHRLNIIIPIIAGVVFMILSCINIQSSIWFDESYSAYLTRGSFSDIWKLTSIDVHPPLFYFALKIWSSIFGTDDFAMRFMSVFFGMIAIVFIFHLVRRWFGVRAASLSTLLLSITPVFIRFGQEMRMYTMVFAIIAAATLFLTLALDTTKLALKKDADQKANKKLARIYWIVYAVLVSVGMWTHYFTAFAWIAQLIFIFRYFGGFKTVWKERTIRKNLILTYVVAVALYIPWIPGFFAQAMDVSGGFWIAPTSAKTILDYICQIFVFMDSEYVNNYVAVLMIATIAITIFLVIRFLKGATKQNKTRFELLAWMILLPPVLMIFASLPPLTPLFNFRYTMYAMIFIWIMLGIVLAKFMTSHKASFKHVITSLIMTAAVITCSIIGIINIETRDPKGYIKYALAPAFQISHIDNEPIIINTDWNYYDAVFYDSEEHPIYFQENWSKYQWGSLEPIRTMKHHVVEDISEVIKDKDYFWYLYDTPEENTDDDEKNDITNEEILKKFPKAFKGYHIINFVADEHHIIFELERDAH